MGNFSPKTKEAALYILKQVIDEVGSYDKPFNVDMARTFMEFIQTSMQDCKYWY